MRFLESDSFPTKFKLVCISFLLLIIIGAQSCSSSNKINQSQAYEFVSYLEIDIDERGNLPEVPYVLNIKNNNKELLVIGVMHSQDSTNIMFKEIENLYAAFQADLVINEGGELKQEFLNKNTAIHKDGELGLIKYLCDQDGIKTQNGDISFRQEFDELEKVYGREKTYFYYTSERFILPIKYWGGEDQLEELYRSDFVDSYLLPSGIELREEEKDIQHYKNLYQKFFKNPFQLSAVKSDDFSPIKENHYFCEIARQSKLIRDLHLMEQIKKSLETHDKVLVLFGGWHVLAIEPALNTILD